MEQIQKERFHKFCGKPDRFTNAHDYESALHYYMLGWTSNDYWQAEQDAMSKDHQEELNQQEQLRSGNG